MEAVKQGGAAIGCKNDEFVVLATLKRAASELSSSQKKLFRIDENVGIAISGLTADGTAAVKALRNDCISHKFTFESQVEIARLAGRVADKSQISTQRAGARPSGVGMLIAGVDEQGSHLFQTCPSGNLYEHVAAAIGARSQASKTYLERNVDKLGALSLNQLVKLALRALREASTDPLTDKTCSVAVVGSKDTPFRILSAEELTSALEGLDEQE